jgi:hypothetical protein
VNPALVVAALAVVAGGVTCVAARDGRVALGGLAASLALAPLVADPLPGLLPLAARIVAAALTTYLLWIVVRDAPASTRGSLLGWPTEALVAAAAFVVGFGTRGLGAAAVGPAEAQAAGFALIALAVGPIVFARDILRLGIGVILLVSGAVLVRASLSGTPTQLEQLITCGLVVGLGGSVAFVCDRAVAVRGDYRLLAGDDDDPAARPAARPREGA